MYVRFATKISHTEAKKKKITKANESKMSHKSH